MKQTSKFKKESRLFFEDVLSSYNNNEDQKSIKSFLEYVNSGKEQFIHKVILFGEEEIKEYDILTIYSFINGYYLSQAVLNFQNKKKYEYLLNGYQYSILYQILHLKKDTFASGVLGTDLSLIFMLALTYFPEEADLIGEQLVKFLRYNEEVKKNHHSEMTGDFGLSSTVYLSSFLAGYYGKKELGGQIQSFCKKDIETCYKNVVDNLFSMDEAIVNTWVDEMVDFHIRNSKNDLTLPFNHEEWQYFPIEIISLLELRLRKGFEISFIENSFLKEFLPHLGISVPIELDEFTQKLKTRVTG
ncbi:hypothetical protein AAG747_28790 [Rapidithrix thailandica]|uniref:Uncharacterized protein n=1 Tax=Rapidithrix thailandica TaxID=413964 RepID=A0AAW9SMG2_9BACT